MLVILFLAVSLCSSAQEEATSQQHAWQAIIGEMMDYSDEDVAQWESMYDALCDLEQSPVDINHATREDLERKASQGRYPLPEKWYAVNLPRPLPLSPINRQRHSPALHQDEGETRQMGVERLQGNRCPNPLHRGMEVKGCTEG